MFSQVFTQRNVFHNLRMMCATWYATDFWTFLVEIHYQGFFTTFELSRYICNILIWSRLRDIWHAAFVFFIFKLIFPHHTCTGRYFWWTRQFLCKYYVMRDQYIIWWRFWPSETPIILMFISDDGQHIDFVTWTPERKWRIRIQEIVVRCRPLISHELSTQAES